MQLKDFAKIYFAILLLHLVTIFKQDEGVLHILSKGLLLFSLLTFYAQHPQARLQTFKNMLLLAFGFSWLGDLFLLGESSTFFLMGLAAFAAAHVFFLGVHWSVKGAHWQYSKIAMVLLVTLVSWFLTAYYLPLPPQIKVYALAYAFLLLSHLAMAIYNFWVGNLKFYPLLGMALFLASDLVLAINAFVHESLYASLAVMFLYGVGQFLIAMGFLQNQGSSALEPTESKS